MFLRFFFQEVDHKCWDQEGLWIHRWTITKRQSTKEATNDSATWWSFDGKILRKTPAGTFQPGRHDMKGITYEYYEESRMKLLKFETGITEFSAHIDNTCITCKKMLESSFLRQALILWGMPIANCLGLVQITCFLGGFGGAIHILHVVAGIQHS